MKKKEQQMLSEYEIDNIWMSYRYCIPRHTIAAHCHAGDIANNAYGRMTKERMQFISKDINQEIYHNLNCNNWFNVENVWSLKSFRPLDIFYQCLNDLKIQNYDDIKKIKSIDAYSNKDVTEGLIMDAYFYNDKDKFNYKSFMDVLDLEVWQRLANLFDIDNHKWCRCSGGKVVEYYEYWTHYRTENGLEFRKIKCPIAGGHNFSVTTWIDEQFIEEDNIEKPNEL